MSLSSRRPRGLLPAALVLLVPALFARRVGADEPAAIDARVSEAAERARTTSGVGAHAALRELWRRWDQTDPLQIEEALGSIERDGHVAPEVRTYAGLLLGYARRRRGDLEGAKRKIRRLGFVDQWLLVGPFDNEAKASLMTPFGPEEDLRAPLSLSKTYEGKERPVRWRTLPEISSYGWLDLGTALRPSEKVCGYATTFVRRRAQASKADKQDRSEEGRASLWIGASGAFRAYWNGEEVVQDTEYRALDADRLAAPVLVKAGWNRLTVKICGDDEGPMVQARLADPSGAPDASLEWKSDPALGEAAAKNAAPPPKKGSRERPDAPGVRVVPKGDPYARGASEGATGARPPPLPTAGALAGLARVQGDKKASAETLEAYARYLALTGGESKGQHTGRDLASRAAELSPTTSRLLLAAELSEDRNLRAAWVKRARAGVRPGENDAEVTLAEALLARSGTNFRDATPFFDRLLARDPNHIGGLMGRAELYEEAGLRYSALATLEDAVRRAPHSIALLRALAHALRSVGRATDAEDVERRYANLRFDDVTYLRAQAELSTARRDVASATRWLERLLALDPDGFTTLEFAARSFRALGSGERAYATLERRLEVAPEDVEAMRALAELEGEDGKKDEQLKLLRRILVLRPQAKDVREYVEHAQPPKIRRDEAFAWDKDRLLALAQKPQPGGFPKRTLRDLQVTTVYPNGLASRFHQVVFQPLTEEGAAAARQYAFAYQAGREVVDVRAARVFRQNGQVDESIETGEGPADNPALAMYTSSRTFYLQLPRLSPGDIVELRYRLEEVTPRNEFGDSFSETNYLQSLEPTSSSEFVLLTPKSRKVNVHLPALAAFKHEESDDGDMHVVKIEGSDIPPLSPEPNMPPFGEVLDSVNASTFSTWDDVGKWYWGLSKDQFDADDEVRRKVAEITRGLATEADKVRAVYDYVVQRTRYVALEFGIEGFRPRRCAQTLARGWGDCKDKATVIVTMLRELGIPANIVLVRTQLRGDGQLDPPSYAFFDHAIAYVPKMDIFLDGTAEYTGMTELPPFDRGARGLIVSEGGGAKLVRLPEPAAGATLRTRKIEIAVPESGSASVDLRLDATGAIASAWRQQFHAKATQRARVTEDLGGEFGGLSLSAGAPGLEVNDLENVDQAVRIHLHGKALGVSRSGSNDLSFAASPLANLSRYASLSSRRHDVKLPFAYAFDDEWTIKLPPGAALRHAPEDKHLKSAFGALEVKVEKGAGKIVVRTQLTIDKTRITPAEYEAFRAFCEEVDRLLADRVVVGK